jgi:hypothetical protein
MGKNSKKRLFPAPRRRETTSQVVDFIAVLREFRYATKQRNFGGLTGEINSRTAELQRN